MSLTVLAVMSAHLLGIMPDGYRAALKSRATVAESLAVQLAAAANDNDGVVLRETLNTVVERNSDVLSAALRRVDGELVVAAGDHDAMWKAPGNGKSTPTHVIVPLNGPDGPQGTIEIHFAEAKSTRQFLGFPVPLLWFITFLASVGFISYFILLRRSLKQLSPGRVMPERVQRAFDTLGEGVIMVDEKERILLVNAAFARLFPGGTEPQPGAKINALGWRMSEGGVNAGGYPWHEAIKTGATHHGDRLSLRTPDGAIHHFNVNTSVINADNGRAMGAIVTLADTTAQRHLSDDLAESREHNQTAQEAITRHQDEIRYLKSHDLLSGCLRRQTMMGRLETDLASFTDADMSLTALHVNIDGFRAFNRDYGHATGDRVLGLVGAALRSVVGTNGYVARDDGDEFSIIIPGASVDELVGFADILHDRIMREVRTGLSGGVDLHASIGMADITGPGQSAALVLDRAREAIYLARKPAGTGVAVWQDGEAALPEPPTRAPVQSTTTAKLETPKEDVLSAFLSETTTIVEAAKASGRQAAITHLSIDAWDYLSEALGQNESEALLHELRMRATPFVRTGDCMTLSPNNGSLLICFSNPENRKAIEASVSKLISSFEEPFHINGTDIFIACNAGIAVFPDDGGKAERLLTNAASAMRRARDDDKGTPLRFYDVDMVQSSKRRLMVESGIREALQRNQFELFFQPIVDLQTGALSAAECLLRCNSDSLKGVFVDEIIQVAEQSSLIADIDVWVVRTALAQMADWDMHGIHLPKISINISGNQFTDAAFMDNVFSVIRSASFAPSRVQIEVTETAQIKDIALAAPQVKRLQQLGVIIALDDFGRGQASLSYLQTLHPDVIKIDRAFITDINSNHASATMVSAMTIMAKCMGLTVVVEGVETEAEMLFLRDTKCDEMQGYFIAKPMPLNAMTNWMRLFLRNSGTDNVTISEQNLTKVA